MTVTYEPCPFCDGKGKRAIPPPALPQGGGIPGSGRRHGYESTYISGCKCELCRAAHREGSRRRRAAKK